MTSNKGSPSRQHLVLSLKKGGHGSKGCRKCKTSGGSSESGDTDCGSNNNEQTFKKGPWTEEEDALLIEYVKNRGERHWNCVQRTGLMRCGKSCRLRWTNHLRPNLKKGAFTSDEERVVLELHAKLGNKWSKIAAELPGRTDNEVKNFWNTKIKRRMKANSHFHQQHTSAIQSYPQQHQHQHHQSPQHIPIQQLHAPPPNPIYPSLPLFNPSIDFSTPTSNMMGSTIAHDPLMSFLHNPAYRFKFSSNEDEGHTLSAPFLFTSPLCKFPLSPSSSIAGSSNLTSSAQTETGLVHTRLIGNMSSQTQMASESAWMHTSDGTSATSNGERNELNEVKGVGEDGVHACGSVYRSQYTHGHSSIEMKEPLEEIEPLDDDLSSLLHDFSSINTPHDWYNYTPSGRGDGSVATLYHLEEATAAPAATGLCLPPPQAQSSNGTDLVQAPTCLKYSKMPPV